MIGFSPKPHTRSAESPRRWSAQPGCQCFDCPEPDRTPGACRGAPQTPADLRRAEDNGRCEARANGLGRVGQKRWTFRHGRLALLEAGSLNAPLKIFRQLCMLLRWRP